MKKLFIFLIMFLMILPVKALSVSVKTTYVNLSNLTYSLDGKTYKNITEYTTLEDFLEAKESNKLDDIYITDFLYDGVSTVKSPDLDDFIENDSNDTKIKTLEIKVINVNTVGNIEFTGEIKGAMIGVNTNDITGDITLVLNNVNLDTDSKKAPAIYVYNKDKNYTDHKVYIQTKKDSKNYLEGGKLKKVSLVPSEELDKYTSYYSNDSLTNYNKYTNYYGIYSSSEIENILFATVQADNEDLQDGDPYYFYKASGAISSDIDLYFQGEGYLKVTSKNKEGIETKGNLTFSGGTGDYEIYAEDDCLNTTTALGDDVRNDLTIDVNSLVAIVSEDGDEGDAIDSNGKLIINGGKVFAFAHPNSGDAGLDSGKGTYLNGGTIIATGNMTDGVSSESKQKYLYASFNTISKDTLIVIKDQDDNIITAFKTSRNIQNLLYSSKDLNYKSYKVYTGGTIDGTETNGLYTKINSYTDGEEIQYRDSSSALITKDNSNKLLLKLLLIESGVLILFVTIVKFVKYGIKKRVN